MGIAKSQLYFLQMIILFVGALFIYFISPLYVDFYYIALALLFVFVTLIYFFHIRKIAGIASHPFSLTLLFLLAFCIVFFQFSLDLLLSSFSDNSLYSTLVYDESVLVKSIWFLVCFVILLCIGMHSQVNKMGHSVSLLGEKVIVKPFFYLFYVFFILHLLTVDSGYYKGGATGDLEGLAGSILGYFIILLPICFGVIIYNYKVNPRTEELNIVSYIRLFPLSFILILVSFSLLTFLAGDRGPAIRALILLVFGFYITSNQKVSYLKFLFIILAGGFFLSTIKLIGAISYDQDLIGSFLFAVERLNNSSQIESISPFTAELSGSFRAYNTAFSLWTSGHSLFGLGLIAGVLMSVPYAVSAFMQVFDLSHTDINSAYTLTNHVSETYGLGTTVVGDALLNIGFIPTLVLAFFMGKLFIKIDYSFFIRPNNVYVYTIGLYFLMNSVNLARGSIFPAVGNSIFILCFVFFITALSPKKSHF